APWRPQGRRPGALAAAALQPLGRLRLRSGARDALSGPCLPRPCERRPETWPDKGVPMTDQRNMIIAVLLSFIILVGYEYFFARQDQPQTGVQTSETRDTDAGAPGADSGLTAPRAGNAAAIPVEEATTA